MKAFIYPYKPGSESCKLLADGLGIKRIAHKNSKFRGTPDKLIINWGSSSVSEEVAKCHIINHPAAVKQASNKLLTFKKLNEAARNTRKVRVQNQTHDLQLDHRLFKEIEDDFVGKFVHPQFREVEVLEPAPSGLEIARTPEYTTAAGVASLWLVQGHTVVERHILNGNSGAGIKLIEPGVDDVSAVCPLYVKYVPKKQEYRVHVCAGVAVDIQRKARRKDIADEDVNWKVRNHDNGFIFARNEDGFVPDDVVIQAVNAVNILGLDFGAVDVIFNEKSQQAYVLEVNTAPGLSGTTLEGYVARFKDYLDGKVALKPQQVAKEFVGAQEELPVAAPVLPVIPRPAVDKYKQLFANFDQIKLERFIVDEF